MLAGQQAYGLRLAAEANAAPMRASMPKCIAADW